MSFKKNLRRLMDTRHLSVAQLARLSGVPAKTIYHWLAGQQPRKMEHVFQICDLLNITVEEIYGRPKKIRADDLPALTLQSELQAGEYELILRPIHYQPKT